MRDDQAFLIDMVEHAREIRAALRRVSRADFDGDLLIRMGFTHLLQVIGEAARQVSEPGRQRFPALPWTKIVGMRHRLVHEYFRIDFDLVWVTANTHVPELLAALEPTFGPVIDLQKPSTEKP